MTLFAFGSILVRGVLSSEAWLDESLMSVMGTFRVLPRRGGMVGVV
jgi:hypothetical protein